MPINGQKLSENQLQYFIDNCENIPLTHIAKTLNFPAASLRRFAAKNNIVISEFAKREFKNRGKKIEPSIELFLGLVDDYFKRLNFKFDTPIYRIGDKVKTKSDMPDSYISKVIGSKREGIIISECSIPLIDFGNNQTYYVSQEKLKPIK